MTFEEAARDPKRPLSLTPREWMYSVEASLAEEDEIVEKSAQRIAAKAQPEKEYAPSKSLTGLEKIDMGLDQMVQGCRIVSSGILDSKMADLMPAQRRAIDKIKDLLETAIAPYLSEMIDEADSFDNEN